MIATMTLPTFDDAPPPLSQRITRRRKRLKMTVRECAERAGIFWTYWYQIESGQKIPSLPVLRLVAMVLQTSVGNLEK